LVLKNTAKLLQSYQKRVEELKVVEEEARKKRRIADEAPLPLPVLSDVSFLQSQPPRVIIKACTALNYLDVNGSWAHLYSASREVFLNARLGVLNLFPFASQFCYDCLHVLLKYGAAELVNFRETREGQTVSADYICWISRHNADLVINAVQTAVRPYDDADYEMLCIALPGYLGEGTVNRPAAIEAIKGIPSDVAAQLAESVANGPEITSASYSWDAGISSGDSKCARVHGGHIMSCSSSAVSGSGAVANGSHLAPPAAPRTPVSRVSPRTGPVAVSNEPSLKFLRPWAPPLPAAATNATPFAAPGSAAVVGSVFSFSGAGHLNAVPPVPVSSSSSLQDQTASRSVVYGSTSEPVPSDLLVSSGAYSLVHATTTPMVVVKTEPDSMMYTDNPAAEPGSARAWSFENQQLDALARAHGPVFNFNSANIQEDMDASSGATGSPPLDASPCVSPDSLSSISACRSSSGSGVSVIDSSRMPSAGAAAGRTGGGSFSDTQRAYMIHMQASEALRRGASWQVPGDPQFTSNGSGASAGPMAAAASMEMVQPNAFLPANTIYYGDSTMSQLITH